VLLIELEGITEAVEEQLEQVRRACQASGARDFRVARTDEERELLWKGRKNAFGAVGRVSPTYYVQDGVVPRTQIAPTLHFIGEVARKHGLTISNIFHAGDGNMHPIILFDARKAGHMEKARAAGEEILGWCIDVGGTITGEHGVGMEKNELMAKLYPAETLEALLRLKLLFDPSGRLNPGKVLPTGRGCAELRQAAPQG
jgi:glycolate oxidase